MSLLAGAPSSSTLAFGASPSSGAAPAFSFGQPGSATGFSFGSAPASQPAAAAPASTGGFSLGGASSAAGGFSFGGAPAASTPAPGIGLSFGGASTAAAPAASTGAAFGFSAAAAATSASTPSFSLGGAATPAAAPAPAAASTPAFSFGGAAPAGSGPTLSFGAPASSAAAVPSATSTPAFGFGGASSTAATAPAPTTTGGFSFGSGPAAGTGAAAAATSAPAAASTPAPGSAPAFSFHSGPAASTEASTPAAAAPSTAVPAAAPAPSSLTSPSAVQGQPVDDIINEWTSELERRSRSFMKHAEALAEWDKAILSNRHGLLALEEDLRRVLAGQDALERRLQMLEAHQKGIHDSLTGMEGEAERLYREERPLADDEAVERDVLYERAEKVTAVLTRLGEQLGEAISDTNEVTAASLGDGSAPMGKLVRVLNNQLNALMQLEAQTEEMSEKLASLQVTSHSNGV